MDDAARREVGAIDVPALMRTPTAPTPGRRATPPRPAASAPSAPQRCVRRSPSTAARVGLLRIDALGATFLTSPGTAPIAKRAVDAHAPLRLITTAAHRLHASRNTINYVVLLNILDRPTWSAYFRSGAAFQADAHGRITRRIQ